MKWASVCKESHMAIPAAQFAAFENTMLFSKEGNYRFESHQLPENSLWHL